MDIPFGTIFEGVLSIVVLIIGYLGHLRERANKLATEAVQTDYNNKIDSLKKEVLAGKDDLSAYKKEADLAHKELEEDYKEKLQKLEKDLSKVSNNIDQKLKELSDEAKGNTQQLQLQFSKIGEKLAEINTALAVVNGKLMTKEDIKDIVKLELLNK